MMIHYMNMLVSDDIILITHNLIFYDIAVYTSNYGFYIVYEYFLRTTVMWMKINGNT